MTAVGFEPTPLRNGALSHRLRPLGQTVLVSEELASQQGFDKQKQMAAWTKVFALMGLKTRAVLLNQKGFDT